MYAVEIERRRTWWTVALGILLVVVGIAVLSHVVLATAVSVFFLGWLAVFGGVAALVGSLFRIGKGGFWGTALSGALILVIGVVMLRNPAATAATLTLIAGSLFLMGGIARLFAAGSAPEHRGLLIFGGIVGTALGAIVIFNLFEASFVLLGTLLGIEAIVDGLAIAFLGWPSVRATSGTDRVAAAPA